jgi:hypothetical protein
MQIITILEELWTHKVLTHDSHISDPYVNIKGTFYFDGKYKGELE